MKPQRTSVFSIRRKKIGLIFVREQGLDLEIWNGRSSPCWSMGVVHPERNGQISETVKVPKASRWALILPTYLCATRHIQLPASRPEEIAAMLEYEVPQLVPCQTQSWAWDFHIAGHNQDGTSQILVVLSPLSRIESAMALASAIGIEPDLVTARAALHAARLNRRKDTAGTGVSGHTHWDYDSIDFVAMDGPRLVFMRGSRTRGQNSRALHRAEAETVRSISVFREQAIDATELLIRVGGTHPEVSRLAERLGQTAPVSADRAKAPPVCDGALVKDMLRRDNAARPWRNRHAHNVCVNLLPKHRKVKNQQVRRRREYLAIGLRVCLIVLLTLLCLQIGVRRETHLLKQYRQRLAQIAPQATRLQFLQRQLNMIQAQVQGSVSMLDIIGQMYEILPQDVTIHYLSIDQNQQVVIRAQAKWLSQAFDCIDPLEQSEYLSNVRQSYAHLRELEGQILIDFELRADLQTDSHKETP